MSQIVTRMMSQTGRPPKESIGKDSEDYMDTILRAFSNALESFMTSINKRIDGVIADYAREITRLQGEITNQNSSHASNLCEIQKSVNYVHASIEEIKSEIITLKKESMAATRGMDDLEDRTKTLTRTLEGTEEKINNLENWSRRTNLRFEGIPETKEESWDQTEEKLKDFIEHEFKLPNPLHAHRVGQVQLLSQTKNYSGKIHFFQGQRGDTGCGTKDEKPTMAIYQD